jgi:CRP-like cAMP-binding protein
VSKELEPYIETLGSCALFSGIAPDQLLTLLTCLNAQQRWYRKGAFILRVGNPAREVCVVLAGSTHVIQEDYWGNRSIINRCAPGDPFAESFCCAQSKSLPVSVVAATACRVLFLDYQRVIGVCTSVCGFHNRLVGNMLHVLAVKGVALTQKLEDVTQRSTQEKLRSYLSRQALQTGGNSFTIPFNRQELADYLSVERSALSNVLSHMARAGLLRYHKNRFELLEAEV